MTNTETRIGYSEIRAAMRSTLPTGEFGVVSVRPRVISEDEARASMLYGAMHGGRGMRQGAGTITALYRHGGLWMSDSVDEMDDHIPFVRRCHEIEAETVLIGGLGMGMVVTGLCIVPSVREITVIEIDLAVVALVGPHLTRLVEAAGKKLTILTGSVFEPKDVLPKDFRFDAAWFDIWQHLSTDNLAEMGALGRRYSRRCGFVDHWARDLLKARKRQEDRRYRHW
ncbi:MAG: hypothetical protein WC054_00535 [Candidatus Nanopelagicales bacterium]